MLAVTSIMIALAGSPGWAENGEWSARSPDFSTQGLLQDHARDRLFVYGFGYRDQDAVVESYTSGGQRLWGTRYGGPAGLDDELLDGTLAPDGSSLFVAGMTDGRGDPYSFPDFFVGALDADSGAMRWTSQWEGGLRRSAEAMSVAVDPQGAQVFAAGVVSGYQLRRAVTVALDAVTGAERWRVEYEWSDARAHDVIASPDGKRVVVLGTEYDAVYGYRRSGFAVAYDSVTGAVVWRTTGLPYGPSHATWNADGSRLYLAARDDEFGAVGLDAASGKQVWSASLDLREWSRTNGLAVGQDAVYLTGSVEFGLPSDLSDSSEVLTAAFDVVTGQQRWQRRYDGRGRWYGRDTFHGVYQIDPNEGTDVALSEDGKRLWVAALELGPMLTMDVAILSYDPESGADLGLTRFGDGWESNYPSDIGTTPEGGLVLASEAWGGGDAPDLALYGIPPTTCASGSDEKGVVSRLVHELEPEADLAAPVMHAAGCVLASAGH